LTWTVCVRTGTVMTEAKKIVFQGEPGANSHLASREVYPDYEAVPCSTFEEAFVAFSSGFDDIGMITVVNSFC
jgi:prephenate dehydratase